MVPVRVADILHYWSQCKDLECLKDMDRRFQEANILGKLVIKNKLLDTDGIL